MQVWNVLHAARWKCRTQKIAKKSPYAHHGTTLSGYIFATKAFIDNREEPAKQRYLLRMFSQYDKLRPPSGWDPFGSLGHLSKYQRVSVLASLLQRRRSLEADKTLHNVWPSPGLVHYTFIFGGSCPWRNFARCKIHFVSKSCYGRAALWNRASHYMVWP